jgi:L-alanine-DL-glutamate epimerase-like enolase superfamily enzyme
MPPAPPAIETRIVRLNLRRVWTTTTSSSRYRDTLHTAFTREGITGHGEGAPIVRYREDAAGAQKAAESVRDVLLSRDPMQFSKTMAEIFRRVPGEWAGKAALDIALMDWVGQKLGIPLYSYFGLDPKDAPITTFSIGIDTPEITKQKTQEAADFPVLKVKVGLATDEPTIEAVRGVTEKPLRVDANEGWTNKEEAVRKINWLETQGVEFIEQPMPAEMIEETRWVRSPRASSPSSPTKPASAPADIVKLKDAYDGVNVKLDKSGGMLEAYRMIADRQVVGHAHHARLHGIELRLRDRGRAPVALGGLRRPGWQPADLERPIPRRDGRKRQADSAGEAGTGIDAGVRPQSMPGTYFNV